ncbi:RNA polymerase sigma factor [Phytoactinopolyspora limicola]|uniref:RNA polymerase sigma factor n=1 Tax=Phytoactinopolyspora limicola TaxID=2715536 RepID=UPI001A9C59DA|nr:DUF6596 domain-containing protein [Phytoactinopolyspora limicola]
MTRHEHHDIAAAVEDAHRHHWAQVLASVARVTRDLDTAEDATQEAFAAALEVWGRQGVPGTPAAWLTTVARRKALDNRRRADTLARKLPPLVVPGDDTPPDPSTIPDDRLRLIFTCCHPALAMPARVGLTLRLVCGLTTPTIARLFLIPEATMAARITRAKKKIRAAGIPYRVPTDPELPDRLPSVLAVVSLLFTEAHTASAGAELGRAELAARADDLAATLRLLMPDEPEVLGLLAMIRLARGRSRGRVDPDGGFIPLRDHDRSQWDAADIDEGRALAEQAVRRSANGSPGPYTLHAAIAAVHSEAPSYEATDWPQVLALYDVLLRVQPSPVTRLARAAARAMVDGPATALADIDALAGNQHLMNYYGVPATRADLLRQLDRPTEAAAEYRRAATLTGNAVERKFLLTQADIMDHTTQ